MKPHYYKKHGVWWVISDKARMGKDHAIMVISVEIPRRILFKA